MLTIKTGLGYISLATIDAIKDKIKEINPDTEIDNVPTQVLIDTMGMIEHEEMPTEC